MRCGLEGVAELSGSHTHRPAKYLSEMARTRVTDFERDFDEAAGCFSLSANVVMRPSCEFRPRYSYMLWQLPYLRGDRSGDEMPGLST